MSLNYQLRKTTKARGQFPNDDAAVKILWLTICNTCDKRAAERAKESGTTGVRKAPPKLVQGQKTQNWQQVLSQLAIAYPERIEPYL